MAKKGLKMAFVMRFLFAVFCFVAAGGFAFADSAAEGGRTEPLPPERVFMFSANASGDDEVRAVYAVIPGAYLYRDRFFVSVVGNGGGGENIAGENVVIMQTLFAEGEIKDDPFFGKTEVYYHSATIAVKLAAGGAPKVQLAFISQGCDEQVGICYPPHRDVAAFDIGDGKFINNAANITDDNATTPGGIVISGDDSAAAAIIGGDNVLWMIAAFFAFGLLLSFTPCVLPMLPVLFGVIGGGKHSRGKVMALTISYVAGVCAVITAMGVVAGWSGALLGVALQRPPMLIAAAVAVALLSLAMFGFYDLQMPAVIRNWAARRGSVGGRFAGAFVAGGVSAAVLSPCVAAPLAGALLYIANTGDAARGALALFSLSMGMSALLLFAGASAGAVLPKAGAWMMVVKPAAGLLLLALAVWILTPLVASSVLVFIYGLLFVAAGVLLWRQCFGGRARKIASVFFAAFGVVSVMSAISGGRDLWLPFSHLSKPAAHNALLWQTITSLPQLNNALTKSGGELMVVVYADWCVSCREFEEDVIADARVQKRLSGVALVRADITDNNADARALLKHFALFGPPAVVFYDGKGGAVRLVGYQTADELLAAIN
ncbi:MAG: protein-disulfide reductase DsbD [Gammaproteobacteria bacterium]